MKYIKTFESTFYPIYKPGDYIIVDPNKYAVKPFKCLKILKNNIADYSVEAICNDDSVEVKRLNVKKYDIFSFNTSEVYIQRKATTEEIEEYNLLKDINKFNI